MKKFLELEKNGDQKKFFNKNQNLSHTDFQKKKENKEE